MNTQDSNLEEILRALRRRWPVVLLCVVLAAGAAVGFSSLQHQKYTASAAILFRDPGFDQQLYGTFTPSNADPARQAATNQHLVSLPVIAQRTSAALQNGLTQGAVQSEVSVSSVGQANLVQVSATDRSPSMAARISNTYASQFVRFSQDADRAAITTANQLLQHDLAQLTPAQRQSPQGLSLSNRAQQLRVLAAEQTGNANLVQMASPPSSPSSPKTTRNGILGGLCGLLLGLGVAFLLEQLDRRLRDPAALQQAYGLPLLGVVPASSSYKRWSPNAPLRGTEAEAFRLLRARLRYFNADRELRSLLVTSAAPSDGKTTVAVNLACAEASSGDRDVVLLEADLRRPEIAGKLGINRTPGLSEVLSGNVLLDDALQVVDVPSRANGRGPSAELTVLPAGSIPPNPAELLDSDAMVELLAELAGRYHFIVIDSPPVPAVSDAIPLMRLVSGVVVVSRVGKSMRDVATHVRDELVTLNAPVLGLIANAVSIRNPGLFFVRYDPWEYSEAAAAESVGERD